MKTLLLGVGKQGKAALYDLAQSEQVTEILAADKDIEALRSHVQERGYDNVRCAYVDAADPNGIHALMADQPDVVIDLLPVPYIANVASVAVHNGVHLVNTFYTTPEVAALADQARSLGITILPEFGLDPGIDLVLLGQAVRSLDRVSSIITYGAGFPEPKAADNPLKYKISWTFEGVLRSYLRAGRVIRDGEIVEIRADEMFLPKYIHDVEIAGLGRFEAFPNGDALSFAGQLGLDVTHLHNLGRYTLRWPGHCAFWRTVAQLGLLDDEPVILDGVPVDRKRYLATAMEPRLQYKSHERDVIVIRVEVDGTADGQAVRDIYQVIDWRDLETGHTAMSRTVGYTASIGAQMIGSGQIGKPGLLSPLNDVPYDTFVQALAKRGIQVTSQRSHLAASYRQ
jgi:saccharopine dehydrogenase-like NADP-dependent oxidoreductase